MNNNCKWKTKDGHTLHGEFCVWSTMYEELNDGIGQFPAAVCKSNGTVHVVYAENLVFVLPCDEAPPKSELVESVDNTQQIKDSISLQVKVIEHLSERILLFEDDTFNIIEALNESVAKLNPLI